MNRYTYRYNCLEIDIKLFKVFDSPQAIKSTEQVLEYRKTKFSIMALNMSSHLRTFE